MATSHFAQQVAYNAGWNKGRWPDDEHYRYTAADFADEGGYTEGLKDGIAARLAQVPA